MTFGNMESSNRAVCLLVRRIAPKKERERATRLWREPRNVSSDCRMGMLGAPLNVGRTAEKAVLQLCSTGGPLCEIRLLSPLSLSFHPPADQGAAGRRAGGRGGWGRGRGGRRLAGRPPLPHMALVCRG